MKLVNRKSPLRSQRLALVFAGLLAPLPMAVADGGYLVLARNEATVKVSSDAQRALVVWEAGRETLHVRSSYRGPAAEFAWVIPVPARPKVERSDWKLFAAAEAATRPEIVVERLRFVSGGCGCSTTAVPEQNAPVQAGVRRLESLDIRELHVEILAADDAGGFVGWLRANGYAVGPAAGSVLDDYVKRRFFFVAVRIRESGFWAGLKTTDQQVKGELTPLAISFAADRPFYPLAISAISAAWENELLLLVAAGRRVEPNEYACAEMTSQDVRQAVLRLGEDTARSGTLKNLDLSAAVKAAERRLDRPGLIVEKVTDLAWTGPEHRRFKPFKGRGGEPTTRLTRFHALLQPGEMKDITFKDAAEDVPFPGRFLVRLGRKGWEPAPAPAGLLLIGLATTLAARAHPRRPWLRLAACGLFLAALCSL